ncbi:MAG: hypothetical protein EXQ63_02610 [Ilumatobacteraceae bacterium]|nr:hypothetical protein [Ilumatobacteraceae bacterium]
MSRITVSIDISTTPEKLWDILEPIERHIDWMADAVAIRFIGEKTRGVGTQFFCDTKVGPIKLVDQMNITSWDPGKRMGVQHIGIVTGTGEFTLSPLNDGADTRFVWTEELTFPWWLGGPIGAFIGGRIVLSAIWRRNLKALKKLAE